MTEEPLSLTMVIAQSDIDELQELLNAEICHRVKSGWGPSTGVETVCITMRIAGKTNEIVQADGATYPRTNT